MLKSISQVKTGPQPRRTQRLKGSIIVRYPIGDFFVFFLISYKQSIHHAELKALGDSLASTIIRQTPLVFFVFFVVGI